MTAIDPKLERSHGAFGAPGADEAELAMLRHDVRSALQGVIGGVGLVDPVVLGDETREQFERVAASARTLARLVGAILGETPEPGAAGRPRLSLAPFLDYVRRRHAGEARERGLELRVETEGTLPEALWLDSTPTARIVDNLVGNALKFGERGEVRLTVRREADGSIAFHVADDGPGMPPEAIARAFAGDRPAAPDGAGHGLGLQIVRSLADRLGGRIALANRPAGGLEAALRFPAAVAVAAAGGAAPERPAPDLAGVRVLLAEDNPTNQMVASQMLRALKAEVTVCADGVEALERFELQPVDLVVVDIEMPRLSGLDVIRAIRSRADARAQVPIVALTAYAMREHRERIAAAGANGLISKPVTSVEALGRGLAVYVTPRTDAAAVGAERSTEAAEAGEAGPVIDLGVFDALCEAIGPDTMAELLDKVVADLLGAQQTLAAARDASDPDLVRSASHILISVAGAIGAVRLQACARVLNAAAHGDAGDRIAGGVGRCIAEIDAATAFARARRAAT